MTARIGDPTDQYGREVRIVRRVGKDGAVDRLADHMVSGGFARPYRIGGRSGWC
jgi:endonuclease YncB( thermonuclease family)